MSKPASKGKAKIVYTPKQEELIKVASFLQKKGLKEKEAVSAQRRIHFFRGVDFHELVCQHANQIEGLLKLHSDFGKFETMKDSVRLGTLFIDAGLIRGFKRIPDEQRIMKWPKKLNPNPQLVLMGEKDFYMWNI